MGSEVREEPPRGQHVLRVCEVRVQDGRPPGEALRPHSLRVKTEQKALRLWLLFRRPPAQHQMLPSPAPDIRQGGLVHTRGNARPDCRASRGTKGPGLQVTQGHRARGKPSTLQSPRRELWPPPGSRSGWWVHFSSGKVSLAGR